MESDIKKKWSFVFIERRCAETQGKCSCSIVVLWVVLYLFSGCPPGADEPHGRPGLEPGFTQESTKGVSRRSWTTERFPCLCPFNRSLSLPYPTQCNASHRPTSRSTYRWTPYSSCPVAPSLPMAKHDPMPHSRRQAEMGRTTIEQL